MFRVKLSGHLDRGDPSGVVSVLQGEGLGPATLTQLHQLVTMELSSERFSRVQLVIKALEILSENEENLQILCDSGLIARILRWYRTVLELLTCEPSRTSALSSLTEAFFDYFLELAQPSIPVTHLRAFLLYLSRTALEPTVAFLLRLEAIRTFNSCLESSGPERRRALQLHQDMTRILMFGRSEMAAALSTVGDYELQASLVETLCRLTLKGDRPARAQEWFSEEVSYAFGAVRNCAFEEDCRHFLNFLNDNLGDQRRVYSFPCLKAFLDTTELCQPQEDNLEFWIDFNLGSECLSFFVDDPKKRETSMWETIHVLRSDVNSCRLTDVNEVSVFVVDLVKPIKLESFRGRRLELKFELVLHSELSRVIGRVFKRALAHVPSVQTYHNRTPSKKRLRVLPLSSPSSDDPMIESFERSQAEILFDQIQHSTPTKSAAGGLSEDELDCSHDMTGSKRHFPEFLVPHWLPISKEDDEVKGGMGSATKRPHPDSGYLSGHTMATPKRSHTSESLKSPVHSAGLSSKEEEIVKRIMGTMALEKDSAHGEGVRCFLEGVESAEEEELLKERAGTSVEELTKREARAGAAEETEHGVGEEVDQERVGPVTGRVESSPAGAESATERAGSGAEENKSVKVKWE